MTLSAPLLFTGCIKDFGKGGTGEFVVPAERVRQIGAFEPEQFATPQAPPTQPTTRPAIEHPAAEVMLTLQECRARALQNNLDLKVQLYSPAIVQTVVTEEEAAFEAAFNTNASFTRNQLPSSRFGPSVRSDTLNIDSGIQLPLQTGGLIRFDVPLQRLVAGNAVPNQNPTYLTTSGITFSQPLLRGFGFDVAAQGIRLAFYQFEQSQAIAKLEVIRVLADTERAYWSLYAARRILEVRQTQYASAVAQLERARREARAGVIAEVDIVRAESGVADQVEQILLAENNVRQQERNLKRIMNQPGLETNTFTRVIPATRPNLTPYLLDRDRLTAAALVQRMEMLQIEIQIAAETANVRIARSNMLPLLAFQYTFGLNGTGQSIGSTFDQVWTKDFESHTFGLQLQVPIGNEAARSRLRRALLARLQQLATREQQAARIRQDVLNAADNFETDWERTLASRKRVELAARTLDVETHQFEQGLRTSTDVLIAQANLADAQSSEVSSVTDYQIAQVDLAFATGTTLGASGVTWRPTFIGQREP